MVASSAMADFLDESSKSLLAVVVNCLLNICGWYWWLCVAKGAATKKWDSCWLYTRTKSAHRNTWFLSTRGNKNLHQASPSLLSCSFNGTNRNGQRQSLHTFLCKMQSDKEKRSFILFADFKLFQIVAKVTAKPDQWGFFPKIAFFENRKWRRKEGLSRTAEKTGDWKIR
jgi:hypothetical protein